MAFDLTGFLTCGSDGHISPSHVIQTFCVGDVAFPLSLDMMAVSSRATESTSVTLKIHMYWSDTKSRERNIGSNIMIHLILWSATLTFLWCLTPLLTTVKHHLLLCLTPRDKKVQYQLLPMSDTMAYVPFPTFGIFSNTQNSYFTPQL
jgi:hypothetical protein